MYKVVDLRPIRCVCNIPIKKKWEICQGWTCGFICHVYLLFACLPSFIWSIRAFTSRFAFFDYINCFSKSPSFFLGPLLLYTLHHIFYFTIHPIQIFLILLPFYIFSHTPSSSLSSHLNHNHNQPSNPTLTKPKQTSTMTTKLSIHIRRRRSMLQAQAQAQAQ